MKLFQKLLSIFFVFFLFGNTSIGELPVPTSISLLKKESAKGIRPADIFTDPYLLLEQWGEKPVPLSAYTKEDIETQKEFNGKETGIVVYAPPKREKEWISSDYEEITPYTWKWIKLELHKKDGSLSKIALRRPNWWIKQHRADKIGNEIPLFLPEMGIDGLAKVTLVKPSQVDTRLWDTARDGDYIVMPLTGTFQHESDDVWNFYFRGLDEPIGATASHPFWSLDRQEWVAAGDLQVGEKVKAKDHKTKLLRKQKVPGRQKVYNLEVYREHNFLVSKKGLLVHNNCSFQTSSLSDVKKWLPTEPNMQGIDRVRGLEKALRSGDLSVFAEEIKTTVINGKTYILDGHHRVQEL